MKGDSYKVRITKLFYFSHHRKESKINDLIIALTMPKKHGTMKYKMMMKTLRGIYYEYIFTTETKVYRFCN